MTITHEERSHDVARTHMMWPGFDGYEEPSGVNRADS
jgi:hypothetical protein